MSNAESVDQNAMNGDDPDAFPRPFGQYLLLENFARGGMGEVYLAKIGGIAGLEKYCVLKKLRAELTRDREYVTRFIDEARVVVTLNHANICHVFDVGRVGEEYYLAMEYISGRDVRTAQDRTRTKERNFPPATALHLVCETLEALDYAHRRNHPLTGEPLNLVHRDVSPQNVLVSFEGEVKLIDFGLAASRLKVERTQPNVVMGKMAYMAPEQARGDPIDARADLFACGVLAYELLSGERFYEGMTANDIWQVAGKGGFSPRRWAAIDPDLQKHLAKALHPDPKRRFATCGDFREALASHLHWKFPGTGVRGLREIMNELFADEVRKERELFARFGKVTVAGFRTEFEESRSTSVSLARADESSAHNAAGNGARLVRNEQSQSAAAGSMPPPTRDPSRESSREGGEHTRDTVIRERGVSGERAAAGDVHKEATRLVGSRDVEGTDAVPKKDRSTDEQTGSQTGAVGSVTVRREVQVAEPTQRVRRKNSEEPPTELVVKPFGGIVDDDVTVGPSRSRWTLPAGAAAVVAVVALIYVVSRGGETIPNKPVVENDVATKVDTTKVDTTKVDTKAPSVDDQADKAALETAALEKAALEKAALEKAALEKAEAERSEKERLEKERVAREDEVARLESEKAIAIANANANGNANANDKAERERARQLRKEKERAAAAEKKAEKERLEKERLEREKATPPVVVADKTEKSDRQLRADRRKEVSSMRTDDVVKAATRCTPCQPLVSKYTFSADKAATYPDVKACLADSLQCSMTAR